MAITLEHCAQAPDHNLRTHLMQTAEHNVQAGLTGPRRPFHQYLHLLHYNFADFFISVLSTIKMKNPVFPKMRKQSILALLHFIHSAHKRGGGMKYIIKFLSFLMIGGMLGGCESAPIDVHFLTSKQLNFDQHHRSLPVLVRVYQLDRLSHFREATFEDLWQRDKAVLGDDLLDRQEISVAPGKVQHIHFNRNKKARYVAAFALFRLPGGSCWRGVKRLKPAMPVVMDEVRIWLKGRCLWLS